MPNYYFIVYFLTTKHHATSCHRGLTHANVCVVVDGSDIKKINFNQFAIFTSDIGLLIFNNLIAAIKQTKPSN